jgi:hypothetical protein
VIFDAMCGIVERHYRNEKVLGWLKEARIFRFPGRLHELSRALTDGERAKFYDAVGGMEFLAEHFFLPFPVVAVEDTASCVVVIDTEENQKGLSGKRLFLEGMWASNRNSEEFADPAVGPLPRSIADDDLLISLAEMSKMRGASSGDSGAVDVFGDWIWTLVGSKKGGLRESPRRSRVHARMSGQLGNLRFGALMNAKAALEEVMFFNTPDRFVVKRFPDVVRKKKAKGLPDLLRTAERPSYILLTPMEIHETLGIGETPTGRKSPVPHARRRHYRTLRSDRYKDARGKVIVVNASWVGPTEGEHKGRKYEVCLDL